jgi:hypothetical protein
MQIAACTEIAYVSPEDVDPEMIEAERAAGGLHSSPSHSHGGVKHSLQWGIMMHRGPGRAHLRNGVVSSGLHSSTS